MPLRAHVQFNVVIVLAAGLCGMLQASQSQTNSGNQLSAEPAGQAPEQRPSTQPYSAMVVAGGAEIRSGPGREYYATQTIANGEIVQVYGEQRGWLAIRPPEGSFSWLREDDVLLPANSGTAQAEGFQTGQIATKGAISQIGSEFTVDRDVWQIEFKQTETVYVLGRDDDSPGWLKIAPPAGEFRWIREIDVERAGSERVADGSQRSFRETTGHPATNDYAADQARALSRPANSQNDGWAGRTVAQELDDLNQRLTEVVSEAGTAEEFSALAQRADAALAQAGNAVERKAAQSIAERIDTFLDLAKRQEQLSQAIAAARNLRENVAALSGNSLTNSAGSRSTAGAPRTINIDSVEEASRLGQSSAGGSTGGSATGNSDIGDPEVEPRYDAVGILTPVSSGNPAAPQYALLDSTGHVAYYLTAAPGMRLQAFEGRYIGVTGNRGFSPELNARHVTARQVRALDGTVRRE